LCNGGIIHAMVIGSAVVLSNWIFGTWCHRTQSNLPNLAPRRLKIRDVQSHQAKVLFAGQINRPLQSQHRFLHVSELTRIPR
jgi:hypothetical protein